VRYSSRALTSLLFAVLAGCYSPQIPRIEESESDPRHSSAADLRAHGTEEGDVSLADLAQAHGLEIKLDKVTGRRILTNKENEVLVPPGERFVVINGVKYPLENEIRWKAGKIYLPGDARIVFGEKLHRCEIPALEGYADLDLINPRDYLVPVYKKTMTAAKGASLNVTIDPHAPPLPASWDQHANRRWEWIVIHHSATAEGGAVSFGRAHARKWTNGLGYDFVIGNGTETRDGEVEVGSRWLRQDEGIDGAHAGVEKYNKHGIGICLVGDFDHAQPSPRQLASLRNLVHHLMARYGIQKENILPHRCVKAGHTECPGKAFPVDAFVRSL
jgi:N-acetylmuramoyl-L-alanine amidase